jgi:hypothetical protein
VTEQLRARILYYAVVVTTSLGVISEGLLAIGDGGGL